MFLNIWILSGPTHARESDTGGELDNEDFDTDKGAWEAAEEVQCAAFEQADFQAYGQSDISDLFIPGSTAVPDPVRDYLRNMDADAYVHELLLSAPHLHHVFLQFVGIRPNSFWTTFQTSSEGSEWSSEPRSMSEEAGWKLIEELPFHVM